MVHGQKGHFRFCCLHLQCMMLVPLKKEPIPNISTQWKTYNVSTVRYSGRLCRRRHVLYPRVAQIQDFFPSGVFLLIALSFLFSPSEVYKECQNSVHINYGEQGALPSTVSWRSPFLRQRIISLQESCQDFEGRRESLLHNNDISKAAGSSVHGPTY